MDRAKTWLASYLENDSSTQRILSMEGQRGIAVALVFLVHYVSLFSRWLTPGSAQLALAEALRSIGLIGVDFFFAISGFVIFMTLDRTRAPMDFIVSRFSRLFPVYWASVLLTAIVLAVADIPGFRVTLRQALANLTMLHGFFRIRDGLQSAIARGLAEDVARILLETKIAYEQPVTIHDELRGRMWVTEMGRIKWHLAAEFGVGDVVHARAEQVGLFIRLSRRRPIAPPLPLRERFAPGPR